MIIIWYDQNNNTNIAHLRGWGYMMSYVAEVYRNFESGGYWGVSDFFRHIRISDKCREEGRLWNAAVITHYTPVTLASIETYVDPNGYNRRVSTHQAFQSRMLTDI